MTPGQTMKLGLEKHRRGYMLLAGLAAEGITESHIALMYSGPKKLLPKLFVLETAMQMITEGKSMMAQAVDMERIQRMQPFIDAYEHFWPLSQTWLQEGNHVCQ